VPASEKTHPDELFYVACTEVTEISSVPPDMISRVVPAGRYAQFTHRGKLSGLPSTMKIIYGDWVANSGQRLRPAPHLERYDRRFDAESDQSEFDILLPVN
jgi:AraC family transcriptional regulator